MFIPTELLRIIRCSRGIAQSLLGISLFGPSAVAADDPDLLELEPITIYEQANPLYDAERRIREIGKSLPELDTQANEAPTRADETLEALGLKGEGIQGTHPDHQRRWAEALDKLQGAEATP